MGMTSGAVSRAARQALAITVAALFVAPLVFLAAGSLRELGPAPPVPELVPANPTLANYGRAFEAVALARQAVNSALLALVVVPLSVLVAAAAGLAIARLPAVPRRVLLGLTLVATMIPLSMLIVGRFTLFRTLGVTDSYLPLFATALIGGSPFNVLLFYVTFRRMPAELFDAARLDGASAGRMLLQIGLPGARNTVLAVAVITFAASWGNVLEPMVYLADEELHTLPLGLRSLATLDLARQPIMLAGALLSLLIPLAALVAVQRRLSADEPELS
jgi:multiple sugar transport system permease protein